MQQCPLLRGKADEGRTYSSYDVGLPPYQRLSLDWAQFLLAAQRKVFKLSN
jgi:hypothetical protein